MVKTIRPKLEFLSRKFIEKILEEAYHILENQGVFVENREALKLFQESGMKTDSASARVLISRELIERSLSLTPKSFKLYDRAGEREYLIGGDAVHFDPGSAAVTILDHMIQEERSARTEDLVKFTRLTECLESYHLQSTGLISRDVPDIISDCYRLYIALQYSSKPVVTGTFRVEGFAPMRDMLVSVRGSSRSLAMKPLAIFDACPSPPLKWSNLTAQSLIDCARAGIPSELVSMGMTGATSPVTLAGTLVQHVAENFSGIAICQLAQPGAPVVFGGSPSSFDMRKGTTPMGAIETMMIDGAASQIGKYLELPTHAYMGLSDAKINDSQAGLESGMGAILAALAGINVVSGPGMMDFESAQSLEKLVIDSEIVRMAYRLVEGIELREDPAAIHLFENLNIESQFLSMPHTRQWYRKEHIFPGIIDRDTYDAWRAQGKKSMAQRAHEEVQRLLRENASALPADSLRRELESIMLSYARANGLAQLPPLG
jgi:trimethylamine--corrinoid protein Co-methyltransferase